MKCREEREKERYIERELERELERVRERPWSYLDVLKPHGQGVVSLT